MSSDRSQVAPQTHEVKATLRYAALETHPNAMIDYDGLDPYWFLSDLLVNHADGHHKVSTTIDNEPVTIQLRYSQSGIRTPREFDIDAERLYEIDLNIQGRDERKADFNISPRFPEMRDTDGERIDTAWQHVEPDEGLAVFCQSSNVRLDELPTLLVRGLHEVAEDLGQSMWTGYFQRPFGGSVSAIERYVRIEREANQKLIGTGGVFDRLSSHLSDAEGTKGEYKWDNEGATGKHQVVRFGTRGARLMVSRHSLGGQLKSYLPRHPDQFEPEDPLYHPKVGSKFVSKRSASGTVDWSNRRDVVDELDERLLSALAWADLPVEAGGAFVADDHFQARPAEDGVPLHQDPLPELQAREEDLLATALSEMTDSDESFLRTLVTDGGRDAEALADDADRHLATVYRFLDRFGGLLDSDNGHVRFTSESIRHKLRGVIQEFEDRVQSAAERVKDLVNFDARQSASSAFDRWAAEYAAEFIPDGDGDGTVRIDTILSRHKRDDDPHPEHVVREMLQAWDDDGRDVFELRNAEVEYRVRGGETVTEIVGLVI